MLLYRLALRFLSDWALSCSILGDEILTRYEEMEVEV